MHTAYILTISLCLIIQCGQSQSLNLGQPDHALSSVANTDLASKPQDVINVQDRYEEEETHRSLERRYARIGKDNQLVIFIAAAGGTLTLMGVVYCIYSQFYNKSMYYHTQLEDDADVTLDLPESTTSFFASSALPLDAEKGLTKAGYGSISDTPAIISVPDTQAPLHSGMHFPVLCRSNITPLQTISAQDLEKSYI